MPPFDDTPIVVLTGGDLSSERVVALARLREVTASDKSMPAKALAALLPGGCWGRLHSLQVGCMGVGRLAERLGNSALFGLAGTVRPVPSP